MIIQPSKCPDLFCYERITPTNQSIAKKEMILSASLPSSRHRVLPDASFFSCKRRKTSVKYEKKKNNNNNQMKKKKKEEEEEEEEKEKEKEKEREQEQQRQ